MTVLQGKLEGLLDGVYPRDDDQLAALLEETGVLSRLIDDLRTLSLAESGALQLQTESTDIADLAREVADGFAASALAGRVTVAVDAPPELPSAEVDPIRVSPTKAILSNITDPNGVRIELAELPPESQHRQAMERWK